MYLIQERIGPAVSQDGDKPLSLCAASVGSALHPQGASLPVQAGTPCCESMFHARFSTLAGMFPAWGKNLGRADFAGSGVVAAGGGVAL